LYKSFAAVVTIVNNARNATARIFNEAEMEASMEKFLCKGMALGKGAMNEKIGSIILFEDTSGNEIAKGVF